VKTNTAPPSGMRDLLPEQVELRDRATRAILGAYARFGYSRVETPALESLERLSTGEGGDNEKLIYRVLKRGGKLDIGAAKGPDDLADLALRYDLTVPLARFYAEHAGHLPDPFRSIQIGPVWRAERPQKGRFRQFTQCDIDILGDDSERAEIELIQATATALATLGLDGLTVRVNDRRLLAALVRSCGFEADSLPAVFIIVDKLDKVGQDGVRKELLAKGHAEQAVGRLMEVLARSESAGADDDLLGWVRETLAQHEADSNDGARVAEQRLSRLCDLASRHLPEGVRVAYDLTLVRGMGYYTGTIFEVSAEGYDFSIAGGGRYDEMIGRMSGRSVPACGFSIGFERVIMMLEERGGLPGEAGSRVALFHDKDADTDALLAAAATLRVDDRRVTTLVRRKKFGRQLEELESRGFDGFAVLEPGKELELRTLGGSGGASS